MEKNKMKVEVLIACMYQTDFSIIEKTNIQSDVLIINQCDTDKEESCNFLNRKGVECNARIIHTTERGVSRSRNMAIENAIGDICLICDDDERLEDDYADKLIYWFDKFSESSVIASRFVIPDNYYVKKVFWDNPLVINYKNALKISSWQIAFKRNHILDNNIRFDPEIGSGVTNAGGEEKIFLHDCLSKGLKVYYQPDIIGHISFNDSQCVNHLFTKEYFIDWGYYALRLKGGRFMAVLLSAAFAVKIRKEYGGTCSLWGAWINMLKGIFIKK